MKKFFSFIKVFLLLLATIWLIGFLWFITEVPRQSTDNASNKKTTAELGVVLTGASGRIMHGLIMLYEERIAMLFISGVNEDVEARDLFTSAGGALGKRLYEKFKQRVIIGKEARSTRGNALEVSKFIDRGLRSRRIIIITSNYHVPRGLHEFNRVFPEYEIVAEPVFTPKFPPEWWRDERNIKLMVSEYHKLAISLVAKYIARETKLSEILANNPL